VLEPEQFPVSAAAIAKIIKSTDSSGLNAFYCCIPRVVASSNPGLKLANTFGVLAGLNLGNTFGVIREYPSSAFSFDNTGACGYGM
jgi:hypothetical protein